MLLDSDHSAFRQDRPSGSAGTASVTLRLRGGLGNQMFQYAAALRIALNNGVPLLLDATSGFQRDPYRRRYALDVFRLRRAVVMNPTSLDGPLAVSMACLARGLRERFQMSFQGRYFDERVYNLRVRQPTLLVGYWQSPRYFGDIEDVIRSEFQLQASSPARSEVLAEAIGRTESVSIHVRHLHGVAEGRVLSAASRSRDCCPVSYYKDAVCRVREAVREPKFFVFADDVVWARENLSFISPCVFVEHNDDPAPYEDLRLMSLCKHHIIANSTFSWWAAWLNPAPEKIVVAPQTWYGRHRTAELGVLPERWIAA